MQLRQSSVHGDRQKCCPHCRHPGLHRHGSYKRHSKAEALTDEDQVAIQRYLCPPCECTCSVLPDDMLPYSPVSASQTQKHFDAVFNGGPAPPATEKERGCFLHRALRRFDEHVVPLRAILGQMLKVVCPPPLSNSGEVCVSRATSRRFCNFWRRTSRPLCWAIIVA